jgi:hypothetical protein
VTRLSQLQGPLTYAFHIPAQATAGTEDVWSVFVAPFDCVVTGATWVPNAAVTADGTNYVTLQVKNGATVVASRAYSATNSVANTKEAMTLAATTTDRNIDSGDTVDVKRAKTGTGLATPTGVIVLTVQVR